MTYDPTLALHCLRSPMGTTEFSCPIIKQRSEMMHPHCEGETPAEKLFDFLVQAMQERNALDHKVDRDKPKRKHEIAYAVADSQVAVLSYVVAMIRNPYDPDPEGVLREAEIEETRRSKKKSHRCPECGSKRLRLEVPPDFEAFEVCKDCGHILETSN